MLRDQRLKTDPMGVVRSNRIHDVRTLTSLPAGKMVPLAAIPLLREDQLRTGRIRYSFEMMETAEILMNAIHVDVYAYLVPWLAFERFGGSMDAFNRVYAGLVPYDGADPVDFFETEELGDIASRDAIYKYLGLHGAATAQVNTMVKETYNAIWNFRAVNRSLDITLRDRLAGDLAPAFWKHNQFKHIVPHFDQALIDGEVPLNVVDSRMPVSGLGFAGTTAADLVHAAAVRDNADGATTYANAWGDSSTAAFNPRLLVRASEDAATAVPDVFAELQENGITVSLANIDMAKKTAAFARLRGQYAGHSDEFLIDMLMSGLSVPDQALKQPMLLSHKSTIFGMLKRYASDSGNLTESVVNGATFLDLTLATPQIPTGGVVMVVAEVTPEQLFERQKDPFFHLGSVDDLPDYVPDFLDGQKVDDVFNDYVDTDHNAPSTVFGFAPLNHMWNITAPKIGGRFYRPEVDAAFDEDRQRIWAVETENPTLSEDFYLCTTMHTKPFVVTNQDPFEVVGRGACIIGGLTVFGPALIEASNDYEKVLSQVDMTRIESPIPE